MARSNRQQRSETRFILTRIGSHRVSFPTALVSEIVSIERSVLLSLPMYPRPCLGVVHHRGTLMPLYSLRPDGFSRDSMAGMLTAIRLGVKAGKQAGIGIEIDALLGQLSAAELSGQSLSSKQQSGKQPHEQESDRQILADSGIAMDSNRSAGDPDLAGSKDSGIAAEGKDSKRQTVLPDLSGSTGSDTSNFGASNLERSSLDSEQSDRDSYSSLPLHIFRLTDLSDQLWSPWRTIISPPP